MRKDSGDRKPSDCSITTVKAAFLQTSLSGNLFTIIEPMMIPTETNFTQSYLLQVQYRTDLIHRRRVLVLSGEGSYLVALMGGPGEIFKIGGSESTFPAFWEHSLVKYFIF